MGDVPINYIEGIGGTRVSEEDIVAVGKHDVSLVYSPRFPLSQVLLTSLVDPFIQGWPVKKGSHRLMYNLIERQWTCPATMPLYHAPFCVESTTLLHDRTESAIWTPKPK